MSVRPRGWVVCWLVALLGSGCVACGGPDQQPAGPVPWGLERFYSQQLAWRACGPNECAFLSVPLDYEDPGGTTAQVALLRRRAHGPEQRIGSLVVDPGGPGASGTGLAAYLADRLAHNVLGRRFDLVGFDPRGVGASQPAVHCLDTRENDAERLAVEVDNSAAGVARQEAQVQRHVEACRQQSGPTLLANIGTRDVARDLDVLRSALGDRYLTYYGYSYGTQIGYTYAERFPRNVRAMVLDGPVDPMLPTHDESNTARPAAFQRAFDTFAAWCARRDCPLGADPGQATARYRDIVLGLIGHPAGVSDGRQLSYTDAIAATIAALYEPQTWEPLRRALAQLASGRSPDDLMKLADGFLGRASDGYDNSRDVLLAVGCVDNTAGASAPATLRMLSARRLAAAPFQDPGTGPDPARSACGMWPVPPTGHPHRPQVAGAPTMLVVAVTGDPATPFQGGVDLARDLGARLITVEGVQHTAGLRGVPCIDGPIEAYLTRLAVPSDGTRCAVPPEPLAG